MFDIIAYLVDALTAFTKLKPDLKLQTEKMVARQIVGVHIDRYNSFQNVIDKAM